MPAPVVAAKIQPVARNQRRFRLWRALSRWWFACGTLGLMVWGAGKAFDWMPPFVLGGFVSFAFAGMLVLIRRVLREPISLTGTAREIEAEQPDLNALLITAIDQEPDKISGDYHVLQQRVIRQAVASHYRRPWDQASGLRLFWGQITHGAGLLFVLGVSGLLWSFRSAELGQRKGRYAGEIDVVPGDTSIERGSSLVITARFGKKVPAEAALVLLPSDAASRRILLERNLSDPVFGTSLDSVSSDTLYSIEYGQQQTPQFHISVFDYPALQQADVVLDYPEYTELPDRTIKDTRRVTAVQGTQAAYTFLLNKPVAQAKLVGRDGDTISLHADAQRANLLAAALTLTESKRFELRLVDSEGRTNKAPPSFIFQVKTNLLANLKLNLPRGDQRFSAIEEVRFEAEAWDDFGLADYGVAYAMGGDQPVYVNLGGKTPANQRKDFEFLLELEKKGVQPGSLLTYYLWADDVGPSGQKRRTYGDMFFGEIRPFDEIFRDGSGAARQQGGAGAGGMSPAMQLAELQKEIINATWNLQRREHGSEPSASYQEDARVVQQSQQNAIEQAGTLKEGLHSAADQAVFEQMRNAMNLALDQLSEAAGGNSVEPLPEALAAEQRAYQFMLRLQPDDFRVGQGGRGGGGGRGRNQRQLQALRMRERADRYETESQASGVKDAEQEKALQVLNRLKELARRQRDLNERLQELQTALKEARGTEEKQEIRRQLKRLREEQRRMLDDMDELRQRFEKQNNPDYSEALSRLDRTRNAARRSAEALENEAVSQALAEGTRVQRNLEELRDDFRKENSSQFAEVVRDLRNQMREISGRQDKIEQDLKRAETNTKRSLGEKQEAAEVRQLAEKQKKEVADLLDQVRDLSEQTETAEPLLSKELYDTFRHTDRESIKKSLDLVSELARLNLIDKAKGFEKQTHEKIDELQNRIDRAAQSVLGDGIEGLRRAGMALDELSQSLEEEIANASRTETSPSEEPQKPSQDASRQEPDDARHARPLAARNGTKGQDRSEQEPDEAPARTQPRPAGVGERGREAGAQSPRGRESTGGRLASNQSERNPASRGQGGSRAAQPPGSRRRSALDTANPSGQPSGGRTGGGAARPFENLFSGGAEANNGFGGAGPITGRDYSEWSDRLREAEEMIDIPELQNQIAAIRDRARAARIEYKRHGKEPRWDLVKLEISKPLAAVRQRVSEELALRLSREAIVPVDRDPVPRKFTELVRQYYKILGGDN